MRTPARFLYSFLDLIFLQVDSPERDYKNLSFGKIVKIVSPTCFEIEIWTHTRVPYSFSGQMVVHFEYVKLSMNRKYCGIGELSFFCWDSSMACTTSILFSNSNFSSMGGLGKRV